MSTEEYRERKRQKRRELLAAAPTFSEFVSQQVDRQDRIGALARDLTSESKRVGKEIAALRNRRDLLWHSQHSPKEIGLTRTDAVMLWAEWLEFEREYFAKRGDSK